MTAAPDPSHASRRPLAHAFIRWVGRRALRWVYREWHFVGREHVPSTGAVLLFGNHPNDVPDVIAGLLTTERPLRYVATITATSMPLGHATYRGLGVIAVTRVRDARKMRAKGIDVAAVNRAAFATLHTAFEQGDMVGIFPEGGVQDSPKIMPPRTGVAKLALESSDNASKFDVQLVPFGIQYESPLETRSDVVVLIGKPFSLRQWVSHHPDPSPVALAERLRIELVGVTRNAETWPAAADRDAVVAVVATMTAGDTPLLEQATHVQARCGVHSAESVHLRAVCHGIGDAVVEAGGRRTSARDTARVLAALGIREAEPHAQWPSVGWVCLAAIPAAIGWMLHGPIWAGVWRVSRALSTDRTDPIARAILPGLHLIFLAYVILSGVFALGFRAAGVSMWWTIPLVVSLPRLGDLALGWRDAVRALRLRQRVRRWSAARREQLCADAARVRTLWDAPV